MSLKNIFLLSCIIYLSIACTKSNHRTLWVNGSKVSYKSETGKMQCLQVYEGDDVADATWENFYHDIEGFNFEEGYLKQIKVSAQKTDGNLAPSDGSTEKYTLVEEIKKQPQTQESMEGLWTLKYIDGNTIKPSVILPTLSMDLKSQRISGNSGCNNYSANITNHSSKKISFGPVAYTKRACIDENIEFEYNDAFSTVSSYKITSNRLILMDDDGQERLSFIKSPSITKANERLHDLWVVTELNGKTIKDATERPRLEFNTTNNIMMGFDGCNNLHGSFEQIHGNKIKFGPVASTQKMCPDMRIADHFLKAIDRVATYKFDGLKLYLMTTSGDQIMILHKTD